MQVFIYGFRPFHRIKLRHIPGACSNTCLSISNFMGMQDSSCMSTCLNHCFEIAGMCSCSTGPPRQWLFGNIPETLKEGGIYK